MSRHVDVVIVGAGVAGALIAERLARAGQKVLMLDRGQIIKREEAVARYRNASERSLLAPWPEHALGSGARDYWGPGTNPDYRPINLHLVGGSTWAWTAMTPRFVPADFRLRSRYGIGVDWPISYEEMEPWYVRAEEALNVAGSYDFGSPRSRPYPLPEIPMGWSDKVLARHFSKLGLRVASSPAARISKPQPSGRPVCCGANTCSPICPTGAKYDAMVHVERAVQAGCRVYPESLVTRLVAGEDGRIRELMFQSPDGVQHVVTAERFVVAAHALETPRLLMVSGLCPDNRALGRYLMDHLALRCRFLMPERLFGGRGPQTISLVDYGRDGAFRKKFAAAKIALSNDLNIQAEADRLLRDPSTWPVLAKKLRDYALHQGTFVAEIEMLPDSGNRLFLDERHKDAAGVPKLVARFRPGAYEEQAVRHWTEQMMSWVEQAGGQVLEIRHGLTSQHPSGTCRMGLDERSSVVNRDLQCHQHPNLYVIGSSVFPTVGTANPTLTIAALALRLAHHLVQQGRAPRV